VASRRRAIRDGRCPVVGPERLREAVRERDERDARFFAWDVPGDAHIVALVHEADEAERSATVADAIATSVARRREHTLLLCASSGPSPLDELLGGVASPGLPAALEGRARLTDVAVQRVDRPFVYLPAGREPAAMRELLGDDLLTSFIGRVRERGGTLFIVLSEETLLVDGLVSLLDGYVALGDVRLPGALRDLPQFGRVRFEDGDEPAPAEADERSEPPITLPELPPITISGSNEADPPSGAVQTGTDGREGTDDGIDPSGGAAEPDRRPLAAPWVEPPDSASLPPEPPSTPQHGDAMPWRRRREKPGFPVARAAVGAVAILGVALAWWLIARAAAARDGAGPASAEAAPAEAAREAPPIFDAAAASRSFENAPVLAYSVLIASYAALGDAEERLARVRARDDGFFFLSSTPVRGVIYHRVFAGALTDRADGVALMDRLVADRLKDAASEWDVRPAGLAFDLGLYAGRDEAVDRVSRLAGRQIPAYALWATTPADTVWRVYGGAYENERAAQPMVELLQDAGEPANLVERRGAVPTPPPDE